MNKKLKISIFLLAALLVVSCGKKEDKTDKATTETSTTQTEEPKAEEKGKHRRIYKTGNGQAECAHGQRIF